MALKLEKQTGKDREGRPIKGIFRDPKSGRFYARFMVNGKEGLHPLEGASSVRDAWEIRQKKVMLEKSRQEDQAAHLRTVARFPEVATMFNPPPPPRPPGGPAGGFRARASAPALEAPAPALEAPENVGGGDVGAGADGGANAAQEGKDELPKTIRTVRDLLAYNARYATTKVRVQNGRYLLTVLKLAGIAEPEKASWSVLNERTVMKYRDAVLAEIEPLENPPKGKKPDYVKASRRRNSAKSVLQQARACLSNELVVRYRQHGVGDVSGFKLVGIEGGGKKYESVPSAIWRKVIEGVAPLRVDDPGAWIGFLIGAGTGLRNREAAQARFDWIETDESGRAFLELRTNAIRTKTGKGRVVPMPAFVMCEIHRLRGSQVLQRSGTFDKNGDPIMVRVDTEADFIIPGTSETHRYSAITRRLAAVLRASGLDEATYPKAYYELRKLFGSLVAHTSGSIFVAAGQLGNLPTTAEKFYVDSRSGRAPLDVLKLLREVVNEADSRAALRAVPA